MYYNQYNLFNINIIIINTYSKKNCFTFLFLGSIDRKWNISTTLEKRLHPMPFTFALSTMFSPAKHQLRMGVGFLVG